MAGSVERASNCCCLIKEGTQSLISAAVLVKNTGVKTELLMQTVETYRDVSSGASAFVVISEVRDLGEASKTPIRP